MQRVKRRKTACRPSGQNRKGARRKIGARPEVRERNGSHVTRAEYRAAVEYMENCGIVDGFTQERTSAREEYTPDFDLQGV